MITEATLIPCVFEHRRTVLVLFRDVTHFNEFKMMREINKNQTKMLRNVSHEFRNPINCILSMLELVQKKISDQTVVQDYIQPALQSSKQLLCLVNDLLDHA